MDFYTIKIVPNKMNLDTIFEVSVQTKTPEHPFYGRGSNNGYVINGVQGETLYLEVGKKYTFVLDPSVQGHPFYFSTNARGGQGLNDRRALNTPYETGQITITISPSVPPRFFYDCAAHEYMGGMVEIISSKRSL